MMTLQFESGCVWGFEVYIAELNDGMTSFPGPIDTSSPPLGILLEPSNEAIAGAGWIEVSARQVAFFLSSSFFSPQNLEGAWILLGITWVLTQLP